LFAVHSIAGELTWLPPLAAGLRPARPVYGFAAPGLYDARPPFATVEEMACAYLDAACEVQREGPLLLCGYSFGGVIAFEMARQASGRGREVAELLLLDSYAPASPPIRALPRWSSNGTLVQLAANLIGRQWAATQTLAPGSLVELTPDARLEAAATHLCAHAGVPYSASTLIQHLRRGMAVMDAHVEMLRRYRPERLDPGPRVSFVRASLGFISEDNPLQLPRILMREPDPLHGWGELLPAPIHEVEVLAEHFFLTLPPSLERVVDVLNDALPT
jgi:thioesterase domain-containing protein